jgi:mono/diheme cytochrome c family protein
MRRALFTTLVVSTLVGCRGAESDKPPVHLIQNMFTQEKGRPYRADTSGIFPDGRMMRTPVEGTVAIGQLDEDETLFEGVADGGQPSMTYPASIKVENKISDETRARGKARYQIYCVPCHGALGDGKGVVASRGLEVPPANFLDARLKGMPVGKIYAAIRGGVNNGNMPSYSAQIPVEDRWAIVTYVRELQENTGAGEESGTGPLAKENVATVAYGEKLFTAKTCVACHTLNGNRLVGPSFKGLFGKTEQTNAGEVMVDEAYLKESILTPLAKITAGDPPYPPAMPQMQFDPIELESLILFIKSQK